MIKDIIDSAQIEQAKELILNSERITIVSHVSPDGDAIGSSLAMYWYLRELGKEAKMVVPNRFPDFFNWMEGNQKIIVGLDSQDESRQAISEAELLIYLDFNTIGRINWLKAVATESKAKKLMIDHHPFPDVDCDVCISYPEIASTSELVFRFIKQLGGLDKLTLPAAEAIYVGMMTDTGNFSYNSQNPEIYPIIEHLLRIGINKDQIYINVYNTYSADRMRLMGYCLSKKMRIFPEQKAALIFLTLAECEHYNYQIGDGEGFVNLPFSIKDIDISIFVRQDKDKIKISFRSQGDYPVNKMAEDFNGGGHKNAAGGESYFSMRKTLYKIEEAIRNRDSYEM